MNRWPNFGGLDLCPDYCDPNAFTIFNEPYFYSFPLSNKHFLSSIPSSSLFPIAQFSFQSSQTLMDFVQVCNFNIAWKWKISLKVRNERRNEDKTEHFDSIFIDEFILLNGCRLSIVVRCFNEQMSISYFIFVLLGSQTFRVIDNNGLWKLTFSKRIDRKSNTEHTTQIHSHLSAIYLFLSFSLSILEVLFLMP